MRDVAKQEVLSFKSCLNYLTTLKSSYLSIGTLLYSTLAITQNASQIMPMESSLLRSSVTFNSLMTLIRCSMEMRSKLKDKSNKRESKSWKSRKQLKVTCQLHRKVKLKNNRQIKTKKIRVRSRKRRIRILTNKSQQLRTQEIKLTKKYKTNYRI